jgi:hypothetical protein
MSKKGNVRLGPAGWSYKDWEGIVYPQKPGAKFDPCEYLARFFETIEINSSFYRPFMIVNLITSSIDPRFFNTLTDPLSPPIPPPNPDAHPCLKTQEFLKVIAIKLFSATEPECSCR